MDLALCPLAPEDLQGLMGGFGIGGKGESFFIRYGMVFQVPNHQPQPVVTA